MKFITPRNALNRVTPIGHPIAYSRRMGLRQWTPSNLFLQGQVGAWYDPSDLSTMFQDSAGTIPVVQPGTVADQPVGRINDKSGNAKDALQATSTERPLLSARVNLLLATTTLSTQSVTVAARPYTIQFAGAGTVTASGAFVGALTNGQTFTPTAGSLTLTVAGSVTSAQLELGSAATTYQRVNTASDYNGVGFNNYLKFDGVDDSLSAAAINFTGTDKMTNFYGVRSAAAAYIVGTQNGVGAAPVGTFIDQTYEGADVGASSSIAMRVRGSAASAGYAWGSDETTVGKNIVITKALDLAGTSIATCYPIHRINGSNDAFSSSGGAAAPGGGTFANAPLAIGAAGGSIPLNGNIYSLIVAGDDYPPITIAQAEIWVAGKTGVTLGNPLAPQNTVAPVVTGTPASGNTLTCSQGTWTGAVSYAYQWYDNGAPIIGKTTSTYLLTNAEKGWLLSCVVSATNPSGSTGAPSNTVQVSMFPYSGSWIYQTPASGSVPAANTIQHANNTVNRLNVSDTNSTGAFVDFSQLRAGDVITINAFAFTVQATPQIYPGYASISINPTTQQPPATYTITVTRP